VSDHGVPHDLVGGRVLVGVQMVDISRLSAHPVPLTHRGLITVAGQGPKDSNGAGKSSFIAALSLLHADEQWRLAGGAPGAAELLFTAELAAQETRWANADRGYVIGVFADPAATTRAELDAGTLTVWLRINRKAPYLSLRWAPGLHVPTGANDAERAAGVHDLWDALPSSNGRDDVHAGRLANVLYGGRVRCVSFLSTSVRSAPSANLLAQPLNELSPVRIFDALATLTGLDRELEQEQALRSAEHSRRTQVEQAEAELERWQAEMAVVERGIARREAARALLVRARDAWRARCARHLLDGVARAAEIRQARAELGQARGERRERIAELEERSRTLCDDEEFQQRFVTTEDAWRRLREQERGLDTRAQRTAEKLDELNASLRELTEAARAADGRDAAQAGAELDEARLYLEDLLAARGAALAEQRQAAEQLDAARTGDDLAAEERRRLADAGVPAAGLFDVLDLAPGQRTVWEPRLAVYRSAVTVSAADADAARKALEGVPGAVLVLADASDGAGQGASGLPTTADPRFSLRTFLGTLAARAGDGATETDVDPAAGVVVLGGSTLPLTGRTARISLATTRHEEAGRLLAELDRDLSRARARLQTATDRVAAAAAATRAVDVAQQIEQLRDLAAGLEVDRERLLPALHAAETTHTEALGDRKARQDRVQSLRVEITRSREELRRDDDLTVTLDEELLRLDLPAREALWGSGVEAAQAHLLALRDGPDGPETAARSAADGNAETCHHLDDVARRCFPDDTPPEEMPAELRAVLVEQRWRRLGTEAKVAAVPALIRALNTHLTVSAQQDAHDQELIDAQRTQRGQDLAVARSGLAEANESCQAHRAVLAQGIQARLARVGEEFDRLDREYGGYGAGLVCPQPEPPTEPDKPWRWAVTPLWRRAEGQRMSGYNLRGNTAQMDEKAVKLVCAAALAGGDDRPLLLILDELGRNLGKQHRREAVALFERIGRDRNITVIGALQDDMERYAIEASNLYIKLRRSSDAVPYNEAPVVVGDDAHRDRVRMLAGWMSAFRPRPAFGPASGDDIAGQERIALDDEAGHQAVD
jgi:chromosome segregation protein